MATMQKPTLHLTALQLDLAWHQPAENHRRIENLLAAEQKIGDLLILPEMFSTGFSMDAASQAEEMYGPSMQWMQRVAREYHTCVVGSLIIREKGKFYNRFLAMDANGLVAQYDKRHPFSLAKEHLTYQPGKTFVTFTYKGWRICPQICYDLRFPVWSRNRRLPDGSLSYDLLLYVANWPEKRVHHWESLLVARAIENQCFLVGVNRVGLDENQLNYVGGSMIVNPAGQQLDYNRGEVKALNARISLQDLQAYRQKFAFWMDADEFEIKESETLSIVRE